MFEQKITKTDAQFVAGMFGSKHKHHAHAHTRPHAHAHATTHIHTSTHTYTNAHHPTQSQIKKLNNESSQSRCDTQIFIVMLISI